mgnify:FL=1
MLNIFKKEVSGFFSSITGYIVMILLLILFWLLVWVYPDYNVFDSGYATLDPFFYFAPWIFIFLIPAITMRSFSEEINSGTIEFLSTKPLNDLQIILGKYFACLFLILFSLLPTLLYYLTVYKLGAPEGNLDSGATWGSYLGLAMLCAVFVSIGIFTSSVSANQIVAFITSVFLSYFSYDAFYRLSKLNIFAGNFETVVQSVGINYHYQSISRGVLDTRDLFYFLSLILIFILLTKTSVQSRKW